MEKLLLLFFTILFLQLTLQAQEGWFEQTSGINEKLNSVHFIDDNNGFIVGDKGTFLKTTDAGENWIYHSTGTSSNLNSVHFLNTDVGFAAGRYSDTSWVIKTTDGGENWIPQPVNAVAPNMELRTIQFIDSNTGWTAGWKTFAGLPSPVLYKTTDGGSNWIHKTPPYLGYLGGFPSLHFIDANEGWAVYGGFDSSAIINTIDGGENWIIQKSGIMNGLHCVQFIDQNFGWVGGNGTIMMSTDGGVNWTSNPTSGIATTSICFVDESNGWIVSNANIGYAGMIQHSTDGGETWTAQITDVKPLWSLQFVDENNGWAVGDDGLILHTTTGGVVSVEGEISGVPNKYNLIQNYPNPFNPSTKIKYSIPQISNVVIKVFDILGNEIETLVNEEKPTGTYELTWYAEGLPSGVYFYRLQAVLTGRQAGDPSTGSGQSFVETKKMLLLR
jgi:photosystem II stability/assembly factor-like uncharacterized protein